MDLQVYTLWILEEDLAETSQQSILSDALNRCNFTHVAIKRLLLILNFEPVEGSFGSQTGSLLPHFVNQARLHGFDLFLSGVPILVNGCEQFINPVLKVVSILDGGLDQNAEKEHAVVGHSIGLHNVSKLLLCT